MFLAFRQASYTFKTSGSEEKYYFSIKDRNNNWVQLDWTCYFLIVSNVL